MTVTSAASPATEAGRVDIPDVPDRARLRRETGGRLRAAMADRGVEALVLLDNSAVTYATGISWGVGDAGLLHVERPVAVVLADDLWPHVFVPFRDGWDSDLPDDHVHGPLYLEYDEGVEHFARVLAELIPATARIGIDECTTAMRRAQQRLFGVRRPVDASQIVGSAQLVKTADELSCIRTACRITEQAMAEAQAALAPGVRRAALAAHFLRRAFESGAGASMREPIWQLMSGGSAAGGDPSPPLLNAERALMTGDVLWTDTSISYGGYCSDFGRTWIVGAVPTPRQQAQFQRWREILSAVLDVTRAGATAADLARAATAANSGRRPWLPHGHLGHGIGVTAAETPMIGTDLGAEFDENFVFEAGMVLVLEPTVWQKDTGGYRGEEVVVITDDGTISLTEYPYTPYGHC